MTLKLTEISALAKRYAKAFFDICESKNISEKAAQELNLFAEAIRQSKELDDFLNNPSNSKALVKKIISEISNSQDFSKDVVDFIIFTAVSRRGNIIEEIAKEFTKLLKKKNNVVDIKIFSARNLDNKIISNISETLQSKLKAKIESENIVDPKLLGGLKIKIGSTVFDDTISDKLERLSNSLGN